MQANKSKYTIIDNGDLMPTFNTELSTKRESCTPLQLVSLQSSQIAGEFKEDLLFVNNGKETYTFENVKQVSLRTDQILTESFLTSDIILSPGDSIAIQLIQVCPSKENMNKDNYWTIMDVTIKFEGGITYEFGFQFTCDESYRQVSFDWSLLLLITGCIAIVGVMVKFGKINSFKIKLNGKNFQGFDINWQVISIYLIIYLFSATLVILLEFQNSVRYYIQSIALITGILSCYFITDELLCLFPIGSVIKRKILWKFRVSELISLLVSIGFSIAYWLTKAWYLGDLISLLVIAAIVKLFKLQNLQSATLLLISSQFADVLVALLVHYTQTQSYNVLTLQYLNSPLELQVPLFELQFNRNCAWISLFTIALPGLFIGLTYRFDRNKQTHAYTIVSYGSFLFAQTVWILSTVSIGHSFPSSIFTYSIMIICTILLSLKRGELWQFWQGNFYDGYLDKNYRLQSMTGDTENVLSMNLFQGLDDGIEGPDIVKKKTATDL